MSRKRIQGEDRLESLRRTLDELGLPDPPAMTFDHQRWQRSADGLAVPAQRRGGRRAWFVAATLAAAAAIAIPVWQSSVALHTLPAHPPRIVAPTSDRAHFSAVAMETLEAGWAWSTSGQVWTTRDGGREWQNVSPPVHWRGGNGVVSFAPVTARVAWLAVGSGPLEVYRTTDRGQRWTVSRLAPGTVGGIGPDALYAASARSAVLVSLDIPIWTPDLKYPETLWRTRDGGSRWTHTAITFAAALDNTGTVTLGPAHRLFLSVAGSNALYVSTGGTKWQAVRCPATPPAAARLAGEPWTGTLVGRPRFFGTGPHANGLMVEQFTVAGAPARKDWVQVLATDDGGLTWADVAGGPGENPLWSAASRSRWFLYAATDSQSFALRLLGTMLSASGMRSFRQGFAQHVGDALQIDLVGRRGGFVLETGPPTIGLVNTTSWRVVWPR